MSKHPYKIREVRQVFFIWMFTVSMLAIALLAGYGLWAQYRNFQQDVSILREEFETEHKKLLKDKVNEAITFARFKEQATERRLKREVKARAEEGWEVAQHLYVTNRDSKTIPEIRALIKEALRPVRFNEGRGYFFIVSLDGIEELYPTRPELEGVNLWDLQDVNGEFVIRKEVEIATNIGEGFVTGHWPNPTIPDDPGSVEYSYVKRFKPLNWLIGTGEFLENVQQELQAETLAWLAKIRYGNDSYIFVDTYTGDARLMDGKPVTSPRNIWGLKDPNGVLVIQEENRIAKEKVEGGFLTYSWMQPDLNRAVRVLTFVKAIPEWEWVVGSSIFLDDIDLAIEKKRVSLLKNVHLHLWFMLGGVLLIIPFVSIAAYLGARKFACEFQVFLTFFQREDRDGDNIPTEAFSIREFIYMAEAANKMIFRRRKAEEQLKVLSLTDPLTGLANRREMENRMVSEAARSKRSGLPISFILLDIDLFKKVNDTFGHDAGDQVLKSFSLTLLDSVRCNDLICRWGGEEFLVMAPDTDAAGASLIAEKIRVKIMETPVLVDDQSIRITVTSGVSVASPGDNLEEAINMADQRLLEGKRKGRNQVVS